MNLIQRISGKNKAKAARRAYCDVCESLIETECFYHNEHQNFCDKCATNTDFGQSHHWIPVKKFRDTEDNLEKEISHCWRCNCVFVQVCSTDSHSLSYYTVGAQASCSEIPTCIYHGGFTGTNNVRRQTTCLHDWIKVASSVDISQNSFDRYNAYLQKNDRYPSEMRSMHFVEEENDSFGLNYYWCCKCGRFLGLNPLRDYERKSMGI